MIKIRIDRVSLPYKDAVAHFYGASQFDPQTDVVVGVVDTGVGPHSDLNVTGGRNATLVESPTEIDDWRGHGTHVAGLIGASPSPNGGVRGLAPGIAIRSYRVFPRNGGATSWAVLRAIFDADADHCDILNLSLGLSSADTLVEAAIRHARDRGMLVVVAAGNHRRGPVTYPAACAGATAVSAMGFVGCFPPGSLCAGEDIRPPRAASADEFIAGFSNFGPEVAITAPGVGVISTLPKDRYGPNSGTSQAAPVVSGAAACLLSRNPHIFGMPRNRARSDALERLVQSACIKRGFGPEFEGYGLPDPALVGTWPVTS